MPTMDSLLVCYKKGKLNKVHPMKDGRDRHPGFQFIETTPERRIAYVHLNPLLRDYILKNYSKKRDASLHDCDLSRRPSCCHSKDSKDNKGTYTYPRQDTIKSMDSISRSGSRLSHHSRNATGNISTQISVESQPQSPTHSAGIRSLFSSVSNLLLPLNSDDELCMYNEYNIGATYSGSECGDQHEVEINNIPNRDFLTPDFSTCSDYQYRLSNEKDTRSCMSSDVAISAIEHDDSVTNFIENWEGDMTVANHELHTDSLDMDVKVVMSNSNEHESCQQYDSREIIINNDGALPEDRNNTILLSNTGCTNEGTKKHCHSASSIAVSMLSDGTLRESTITSVKSQRSFPLGIDEVGEQDGIYLEPASEHVSRMSTPHIIMTPSVDIPDVINKLSEFSDSQNDSEDKKDSLSLGAYSNEMNAENLSLASTSSAGKSPRPSTPFHSAAAKLRKDFSQSKEFRTSFARSNDESVFAEVDESGMVRQESNGHDKSGSQSDHNGDFLQIPSLQNTSINGNKDNDRNLSPQEFDKRRVSAGSRLSLGSMKGGLKGSPARAADANPMIFFIHGVGGSSDVWKAQSTFFSQNGYEVIAPDLIGHGFSCAPRDTQSYTFQRILEDLEYIFDNFSKRKNVIVGHSYGCSFAAKLAHQKSHRVYRLILISGGAPTPLAPQPGVFSLPLCALSCLRPCVDYGFFKNAFHQATKSHYPKETAFDISTSVLRDTMAGQLWLEGDAEFHSWLTVPTLLIHGHDDRLVDLAEEQVMLEAVYASKLEIIEGASHMVMMESPVQVNELIHKFIIQDAALPSEAEITAGERSFSVEDDPFSPHRRKSRILLKNNSPSISSTTLPKSLITRSISG